MLFLALAAELLPIGQKGVTDRQMTLTHARQQFRVVGYKPFRLVPKCLRFCQRFVFQVGWILAEKACKVESLRLASHEFEIVPNRLRCRGAVVAFEEVVDRHFDLSWMPEQFCEHPRAKFSHFAAEPLI